MKLNMKYPSFDEINKADRITIARWYRFLPSPGMSGAGTENFEEIINHEVALMNRINERFAEMGGMTPELSKIISWKY